MTIKEKILVMPVWKAAMIAIVGFLSLCFLVEMILVKTVFSTINTSITSFEKIAKEDENDLDKDIRESNEQQEYDRAMTKYNFAEMRMRLTPSAQEKGCFQLANIKRFEAMRELAFVKHNDYVRDSVERYIRENRQGVETLSSNHAFNPDQCQESS